MFYVYENLCDKHQKFIEAYFFSAVKVRLSLKGECFEKRTVELFIENIIITTCLFVRSRMNISVLFVRHSHVMANITDSKRLLFT